MNDFEYIVVGAGMAGDAAVAGIRQEDPTGTIALIGAEPDEPYNRPALSKALWREEDTTPSTIILKASSTPGVTLMLGTRVTSVNPDAHTVTTADGKEFGYHRLVLTTGGRPRTAGIPAGPRVIHFHDLSDYRALRTQATRGAHVVVVGGGFIGTELAAVLAETPATVTYVFPRDHVDGHVLPEEIARHLDEVYREHGVELVPGVRVTTVAETPDGEGVTLTLDDGRELHGDVAVLGLGQDPETDLASAAGLAVWEGIVVDAHRRTSDPDIFAAGDAVARPDRVFGRRRVQHEDAAVTGGRVAGRNAAGGEASDDHVPYFYSDIFADGYEALGVTDPTGASLVDWKEPGSEAVVYYFDEDSVLQGVLMWNVWGDEDHDTKAIAAQLLEDRSPRDPGELVGAI